jgi:hypothetical protein
VKSLEPAALAEIEAGTALVTGAVDITPPGGGTLAMAKSSAFINAWLKHVFQNATVPNVGDATGLRGSSSAGSLYFALHTADPGVAGDQTANECDYSGYARQGLVRSAVGFTVTGSSVSPASQLDFPSPTDLTNLPQTATHWSVGVASSGAGMILYSGAMTENLIDSTSSAPSIGTATTITEE